VRTTTRTILLDDKGNAVRLGSMVGRGGEGAIYEIVGRSDRLAKVYHRPVDARLASKIRAMASLYNVQIENVAAWPTNLLLDAAQSPVGLIMPLVPNRKDIHKLYSPKSRRTEFASADYRHLIRAASNTARAFAALHKLGCIIGDINHGSVLVGEDATVRLIDCASFQTEIGGQLYTSDFGVETFTPPELQERDLRGVIRSESHDAFGLATLIFLLLFMGRHPFAGRYLKSGEMPISRAIKEARFAYGARRKGHGMERPPHAPALSTVGDSLANLFERAFDIDSISAGRPAPLDWVSGLTSFEKSLAQCKANPSHWFLRSIDCPWCPMEASTGVQLFSSGTPRPDSDLSDVTAIWVQIEAIPHPGPAPEISGSWPNASAAAKNVGRSIILAKVVGLAGACTLLAFGIFGGFKAPAPLFLFLGSLPFYFLVRNRLGKVEQGRSFKSKYDAILASWTRTHQEWLLRASPKPFDDKKTELRSLREQYKQLPEKHTKKLDELKRNKRNIQLRKFLDRYQIEDASIDGIGKGRKQTLASYGIETAADLLSRQLESVPGFGPKLCGALYGWRKSLEHSFVFDPNKPVDKTDIDDVQREALSERKTIERKLSAGLIELRNIRSRIDNTRAHGLQSMETMYREYMQAKVDYDAAVRI
jgi:DNA-binding helix-hairpin-helix protein with protein kinase domain